MADPNVRFTLRADDKTASAFASIRSQLNTMRQGMDRVKSTLDGQAASASRAGRAAQDLAGNLRQVGGAGQFADRQLDLASSRAHTLGTQMSKARIHSANMAAQFNDIGVMLAAGQSPLMLAVQQGSQINQIFTQMGGGRQALAGLAAGLRTMINPLSIATIGIIAGGAALVQWAAKAIMAGRETRDFTEVLDEVTDSMSNYRDLLEQSGRLQGDMFEDAANSVRATSEAFRDLIAIAKVETLTDIASASEALARSATNYSIRVGEIGDSGDLLGIDTQLRGNITTWHDARDSVAEFNEQLRLMHESVSLQEQYEAAVAVRDTFKATVDVTGELSERQLEFWQNLSQVISQMELMGATMVSQMSAAADAGDRFAQATRNALPSLNQNNIALRNHQLAAERIREISGEGSGILGVLRNWTSPINAAGDRISAMIPLMTTLAERAASFARAFASGQTAGMGRGQDPRNFASSDELFRDPFGYRAQLEAQETWSRINSTVSSTVGGGGGLTSESVSELDQQMKSLADTMGSAMSDGFMAMIEGTKSVGDAFRDMAKSVIKQLFDILVVQQLVGSWDATTGTGTGLVGLGMKAFGGLLSFDGGGYTGAGSRSGGLDGKGGFMAMLHPNETVVDHSKGEGQSAKSGDSQVIVQQTINISAGVQGTVRAELAKALPKVVDAAKAGVLDAKRRGGGFAGAF